MALNVQLVETDGGVLISDPITAFHRLLNEPEQEAIANVRIYIDNGQSFSFGRPLFDMRMPMLGTPDKVNILVHPDDASSPSFYNPPRVTAEFNQLMDVLNDLLVERKKTLVNVVKVTYNLTII
jgi:hypothetical protein